MPIKLINPSLLILFGSQGKGYAGKESDFDVGVIVNQPLDFHQKIGLQNRWQESLISRKIKLRLWT